MPQLITRNDEAGSQAVQPEELAALFEPLAGYDEVCLAVSGGADSMALMHLVADWRAAGGEARGRLPEICVLSVDHGLRPEARGEAEWVMARAWERGLGGEIMTIDAPAPESGIQEWARNQRYNVLCARALAGGGASALVTGHHQGDVAETVLMRLARGSGVDGLAAMAGKTVRDGADILRPLLGIAKARLVATLEVRDAAWIEDPSNASDTFERVRLRKLEAERVALGLGDGALARTAQRLGRARDALDTVSEAMLAVAVAVDRATLAGTGLLMLPERIIRELPDDIGQRMLMRALVAVGGTQGQLRLSRLERLYNAIKAGDFSGATLGNAIIHAGTAAIEGVGNAEPVLEIYREPDRGRLPVIESTLEAPLVWDNRFAVQRKVPGAEFVTVRALERPDLAVILGAERAEALPFHAALRATPVIEEGDGSIFAPALTVWGGGLADDGGLAAAPYKAEFMVERLFAGHSAKDRAFLGVLDIICAMREGNQAL